MEGMDMKSNILKEEIPPMWIAGRARARILEGMNPLTAEVQAVADWNEQEWLTLKAKRRAK